MDGEPECLPTVVGAYHRQVSNGGATVVRPIDAFNDIWLRSQILKSRVRLSNFAGNFSCLSFERDLIIQLDRACDATVCWPWMRPVDIKLARVR